MGTEMDVLSLGPFLLHAKQQPGFEDRAKFKREFDLD